MKAWKTRRQALASIGYGSLGLIAGRRAAAAPQGSARWYRGNLHMHSYWSDGRALPEIAVDLYKNLGYDFISLSEHNVFADNPDSWRTVEEKEGEWPANLTAPFFNDYMQAFAAEAQTRQTEDGKTAVRLKTFEELRQRFEEPGRFLMMPGVEITQTLSGRQVHLNYHNLPDVIPFVKGGPLNKRIADESFSVSALIAHDAKEVAELSARLERPSLLMLNHPHWVYHDILPQNLIDNPTVRFFEVCNGASSFAPHPDAPLDNDAFWDVVNAFRALQGTPLLYGLGTDDTHFYTNRSPRQLVGDAWIMARSRALTSDALIDAMQAGDFYATCGVLLDDVAFDASSRSLHVKVRAEPGVAYRIRFLATKLGFDRAVRIVESPAEKGRGARSIPAYSSDIGRTARLVEGTEATYRLAADDLYARARVESDRPSFHPRHFHPINQVAWTQPVS